jgi:hypothetical protein
MTDPWDSLIADRRPLRGSELAVAAVLILLGVLNLIWKSTMVARQIRAKYAIR